MQKNRKTETSPIQVIVQSELRAPAIIDRLTGPANDGQGNMARKHATPASTLNWNENDAATNRLFTVTRRCTRNFDKNVGPELTFKVGDYLFMNHLELVATASYAANGMGSWGYNK